VEEEESLWWDHVNGNSIVTSIHLFHPSIHPPFLPPLKGHLNWNKRWIDQVVDVQSVTHFLFLQPIGLTFLYAKKTKREIESWDLIACKVREEF
jgi:hypothetical protein